MTVKLRKFLFGITALVAVFSLLVILPLVDDLPVAKDQIIASEEYEENGERLVKYRYYINEVAPPLPGELIDLRTNRTVTFDLGNNRRLARSGFDFYQTKDGWRVVKTATTTARRFYQPAFADWLVGVAFGANVGTTTPGTAGESNYGGYAWTNDANITAEDASYAYNTNDLLDGDNSNYLTATNFGFSLPSSATVDGIIVGVKVADASFDDWRDESVRLIKGGTISGTDKSAAAAWTTTFTFHTFGGVADLWGNTLAYSDVNASTFGVAFAAQCVEASDCVSNTGRVDVINMDVYYTDSGGGDTTPPTVTAFDIPATATSLTVSVSSFTATDDTGVTGYKLTESASAPSAGDAGWSASAPTTYTFLTEGSKTLYAWAKDAAGNVSTSLNDTITITLPALDYTGFDWRASLTVPSAWFSAELTNFPILLTEASLPAAIFTNAAADGGDIRLTSDSAGTTPLNREIVSFDPINSKAEIWVKVPTLSNVTDTVIYIWYGHASATEPPAGDSNEGSYGVWDSSFKAVYHLEETVNNDTDGYADSTVNVNHGTGSSMALTAPTGIVGKAAEFDGTADYIDLGNDTTLQITGDLTISLFSYFDVVDATGDIMVAKDTNSGGRAYTFDRNGTTGRFYVNGGADGDIIQSTVAATTWYYLAGRYDNAGTLDLRRDTTDSTQVGAVVTSIPTSTSSTTMAKRNYASFEDYHDGKLDEVRISNTYRTGAWLTAEYNTATSPGSITDGTPEDPNAGVTSRVIRLSGGLRLLGGSRLLGR